MNGLIILFSAETPLSSSIKRTAQSLRYDIETIPDPTQFGEATTISRPGEPVDGGQLSNLSRYLTKKQPVLLIFDLDNTAIAVMNWIAVLKSSPATRRLPVIGYSVNRNSLREAESRGADKVVLREEMGQKSAELLPTVAKIDNSAAINNWCAQPLPDAAYASIDLFNSGQFYEAHHALEHLWMNDDGAARDFYRAILQVAVAYYQIERGNYRGAVKMFLRVRQWLEPLPDVCRGVNLAQLRVDTEASFTRLSELGADRIGEFEKGWIRPITFA